MIRTLAALLIAVLLSCACSGGEVMNTGSEMTMYDFILTMTALISELPDTPDHRTIINEAVKAGLIDEALKSDDLQGPVDITFASQIIVRVLKIRSEIYYPDDITGEFKPEVFCAYIKGIIDPYKEYLEIGEDKKIAQRIIDFAVREVPVQISSGFKDSIKIDGYIPPRGKFLPGDRIISSVAFTNISGSKQTYWIGHSLKDENGQWYDRPASKVELENNKSIKAYSEFLVDDKMMSGNYTAVTGIWTDVPGSAKAERIADASQTAGLLIFSREDEFDEIDPGHWSVTANNQLGRSRLRRGNVFVEDGILMIKLPAGRTDGGEIRSIELKGYEAYEIRMKIPYAPSSITGFFLYKAPDYQYEIDIELYNDNKGEFFLTTYAEGRKQNEYHSSIPYDLTKDFHDWRIEYYKNRISFYFDDHHIRTWYDGFPEEPMYLMVNTWFPSWLEGKIPEKDVFLYIDRIKE